MGQKSAPAGRGPGPGTSGRPRARPEEGPGSDPMDKGLGPMDKGPGATQSAQGSHAGAHGALMEASWGQEGQKDFCGGLMATVTEVPKGYSMETMV